MKIRLMFVGNSSSHDFYGYPEDYEFERDGLVERIEELEKKLKESEAEVKRLNDVILG